MAEDTRFGALMACLMIILGVASAAGAQVSTPCEQDARHHALDFWVGEWKVIDGDGQAVGTNRIEKHQNGCVLEEHWTSASGGTGQSMNYFDPADGVWRQNWVDQGGGVVHYEGGVEDGVLRYEGRHIRLDGTVTLARVALRPIDGGRLRHLIEHSQDGGNTWSTYFDGIYVPAAGQAVAAAGGAVAEVPSVTPMEEKEQEEVVAVTSSASVSDEVAATGGSDTEPMTDELAAPAAVAPLPSEAAQPQAVRQAEQEGSDVKAVTRELQREEIPEPQAPELVMASPMVLEVKPGNIEDYPENTAWRTRETAGFICGEVSIKQVGIGHKSRRDNVNLIVASTLFTQKRQKKVDLLIELIQGGETIASEELGEIRLGLSIPAHGKEGLVAIAELEITREQFDSLFDGDGASEPSIRLTLACPSTG